jgi:hypothetical protein
MWSWVLWAVLLLIQNASFTLVSRARNSGSLGYHAIAAVFSNGIWFLSQVIVVDKIVTALRSHNWSLIAITALFYTIFTVIGSISMHYVSMKYLEKGKRKVGG